LSGHRRALARFCGRARGDSQVSSRKLTPHPDILQLRRAHAEKVREMDAQIAELEASIARKRDRNRTDAASTAIARRREVRTREGRTR
jgi:hypothetical protein